jgi:hypothetical protein
MDSSARAGVNVGRGALQAIFAVFLGLMVTAVVGVGVYTFYPNPATDTQEQIETLYQQRSDIEGCGTKEAPGGCRAFEDLTPQEQAQIRAIDVEVTQLQDRAQQERGDWGQRTSIILIVIATTLMATSLLLAEGVAVMSNGILLGGLFTMLYGVGWGLAAGNSVTRFVVLVAALLVSLGLGYVKFVRRREAAAVPAAAAPAVAAPSMAGNPAAAFPQSGTGGSGVVADAVAADALAAVVDRIEALERRLDGAAAWLGSGEAPRPPR